MRQKIRSEFTSRQERKVEKGLIVGDYIVRAMAGNEQIRAYAATTRDLVEEARQRHGTYPVATAALGRLLTAGSMMGSMMKGDKDLLTLQGCNLRDRKPTDNRRDILSQNLYYKRRNAKKN